MAEEKRMLVDYHRCNPLRWPLAGRKEHLSYWWYRGCSLFAWCCWVVGLPMKTTSSAICATPLSNCACSGPAECYYTVHCRSNGAKPLSLTLVLRNSDE